MVQLRVQSIICLEKNTRKTQIAPPNVIEIANDRVCGTHLRISIKIGLRMQTDAKLGQLKNESKTKMFSVPGDAQESASWTTINAFDRSLMIQFRVHLIIHLELHLKVHFKIYIKVHKSCTRDCTKRCTLCCNWVALVYRIVNAWECIIWFNKRWNWGSTLSYTWRCI